MGKINRSLKSGFCVPCTGFVNLSGLPTNVMWIVNIQWSVISHRCDIMVMDEKYKQRKGRKRVRRFAPCSHRKSRTYSKVIVG